MFLKLKQSAAVFLLAIVALLIASTSACTNDKSGETEATPVLSGPPSTTFPMPPLKADSEMGWLTADGQRQKLADYSGKVLVIDFYATWCEPCRESIPHLVTLQNQLGARGVQIIGLNVGGADDRVKVPQFARDLGVNYTLGFPDKTLTDFFLSDDQTIPQTFVFGREGRLIKRLIGYQKSTGIELEKAITSGTETK
ncbi:MAG TPA: TlpA disulfide reductase family protein [Pyrinomonadaceae bacterium]|nr:TlpA disulfide reductase family protein [Pyrinomonadaceae bacterium]